MSESVDSSRPSLPAIGIFKVLTEAEREALCALGETKRLAPGGTLVEQGETQDRLYLLLEGTLNVTCHSPVSTVALGTIKPGETVGEMNILDPLKASATVKAQHASRVWSIGRKQLDQYFSTHADAGVRILRELAVLLTRRIRRASDKLIRQAEMAITIYEIDA